ncbi:hypothetical protein F7R91_14605 [Streptomyces luteolifulvus]|uniref:DUF2637 domain-containing protein n=1 Tax=Streptomyces luteolifulvus TaxID=2615112 RepID=A0A6H9V395_9ACTN|nr:hypothetical protein [Streptomyces luteolifulvus]KAB1146806.1 hypothetical protein F7R91_14605 [Streptomyces luteolifulvus]
MTASPPLNGHKRPAMPVLGDWQPVEPEPVEEQRSPQPEPPVADAEVARARAWAEAEERRVAAEAAKEERRIKAEAEADAIRAKGEEEARRLRLANDRQERKAREDDAASDARIAESHRKRDEANRASKEAAEQAKRTSEEQAEAAKEVAEADEKWRKYAIRFAIVCAIVALPVQMNAFWNREAPWLIAAPIMLEGAAWVVHRGARAAVANGRPVWHYRTIVWLFALIAAAINLFHGIAEFDLGTAIGTAFASVAGPGVWDLHEHGRIRKRDGVKTRRERKAQEKAAKVEAARRASEEKRRAAENEAAEKAAAEARKRLAEDRAEQFPDVWDEAVKIAAAVGSTTDDAAVWARAYRNIKGCDPGESIESITARRAAEKRVEAALTGTPVNTLSKTTNAQRAIQVKAPRKTSSYKPVPPRRKKNDTPRFHPAARALAADAKRTANARQKDAP